MSIYFDEYKSLPNAKKRELGNNYVLINLFLEKFNYDVRFENEELTDTTRKNDLPPMPPLENDEEVKEKKEFKILTLRKLLTRLAVLLTQVKAGNNSYKLKNEIRQILCLLYQHNKIMENFTTD